jgi:hypothetical protein
VCAQRWVFKTEIGTPTDLGRGRGCKAETMTPPETVVGGGEEGIYIQ